MKHTAILASGLCALALLTVSCKSQESAYRKAYERAKAQELNKTTQTVTIAPQSQQQTTIPVTTQRVPEEDNTPVRTIEGNIMVVNGEPLKAYSVVVGSFINQTNAEGVMAILRNQGYTARVVKTNDTINGHTGWFRVVAASFDNKSQAVQTKATLSSKYPGVWLLGK